MTPALVLSWESVPFFFYPLLFTLFLSFLSFPSLIYRRGGSISFFPKRSLRCLLDILIFFFKSFLRLGAGEGGKRISSDHDVQAYSSEVHGFEFMKWDERDDTVTYW